MNTTSFALYSYISGKERWRFDWKSNSSPSSSSEFPILEPALVDCSGSKFELAEICSSIGTCPGIAMTAYTEVLSGIMDVLSYADGVLVFLLMSL